jgi:hypothetical protein
LKGSFSVLVDTFLTMNANFSNHILDLMREHEERRHMQEQLEAIILSLEEVSITEHLTTL